ncbi:hypothetical protein L1987_59742 [Smallanthus sonchifolius]|uniref:Uncharacterized protein n=1 Tax=Smallanthus sonchifolius TaxID=185202 RepID=A0ACB9D6Y3_9ASTR|nr:hypothetical protein L1987_59742 [Smallanthus sonchifolius]
MARPSSRLITIMHRYARLRSRVSRRLQRWRTTLRRSIFLLYHRPCSIQINNMIQLSRTYLQWLLWLFTYYSAVPSSSQGFSVFAIIGVSAYCTCTDTMVSIRRQRLIKLYGRSPFLDILSSYNNGQSTGGWVQNTRFGMHPLPSVDVEQPDEENKSSKEPEPSIVNESSSSSKQPVLHPEFKRRKRHRRKNIENQEVCVMRGVYFKNMKWQAAIKVDKKQIHLGTVSSQEEAARLYDRAAFMCGREPNFELTIKEKDELSKLSWDEFLAMTRSAINSKKNQRRVSSRMKFEHRQQNSNSEAEAEDQERNGFSGSDDADTSLA